MGSVRLGLWAEVQASGQARSLGRVCACSLFHSVPSLRTCCPLGCSHAGLWTRFHLSIRTTGPASLTDSVPGQTDGPWGRLK